MHRNYMRSIPRQWRVMARVFVALGDDHRQRILLTFEAGERLTAGQPAAVSTLSRPAVSHHLKLLREAGVLRREKIGRESFSLGDRGALEGALAAAFDHLRRAPGEAR